MSSVKYDVGNVVSGAHCIKNICRKYMEKLIHVENGMVNWIVLRSLDHVVSFRKKMLQPLSKIKKL